MKEALKSTSINAVSQREVSPYLFISPQQAKEFMTPDMREWLSDATIVHIAPPWLPVPHELRKYGGIENVLEAHIAALSAAGVKRQIVIGHPGNKLLEEQYPENVTVITPGGINYDQDLLKLLRTDKPAAAELEREYVHQAYRWIAEHQNEITVVHDHTDWGRVFGPALNPVVPVVRTEHNSLLTEHITELIGKMLDRNARRTRANSPRNILHAAISKYLKTEKAGLNWWTDPVYNGVDLSTLEYSDKNEKPINEEDRYLLYLGRVSPNKGVHHALEVGRRLGMKVVIACAIEETVSPEYRQLISWHKSAGNVVHYENGVDLETKRGLLKNASALLVLGEWNEPFGMVAIEALASGTPVVAFRRGALPEIVDQRARTGFIVDDIQGKVNIQGAVDAVKRIVEGGEFSSRNCRRRVERHFSNDAMTAGYVRMYMSQEEAVRAQQAA